MYWETLTLCLNTLQSIVQAIFLAVQRCASDPVFDSTFPGSNADWVFFVILLCQWLPLRFVWEVLIFLYLSAESLTEKNCQIKNNN